MLFLVLALSPQPENLSDVSQNAGRTPQTVQEVILSGSPTNTFHLHICAFISFVLTYIAKHIVDKALVPKTHKVKFQPQANNSITKMGKDLNEHLPTDTQMGNKPMGRRSPPSVSREMRTRNRAETPLQTHQRARPLRLCAR